MGRAPRKKGNRHFARDGKKISRFISRSAALAYLQIPLARFRQLCILKGVYPRDIRGTNGTYYSRVDIEYIARDPLISKFREWKRFMQRYTKAKTKEWDDKAQRLSENAQVKFRYDHLVKERYPTLQSALSDLDDCLTLLFMFSKMPAIRGISPRLLGRIKRACDEFCTYVTLTKSLRKVFLSFKGIYYQAVVLGQTVTWVVPYDFPHAMPTDVDFSVFHTFITFYETLQAFINYKLFHSLNIPYPPKSVTKNAGECYCFFFVRAFHYNDEHCSIEHIDSDFCLSLLQQSASSMVLDLEDETNVHDMLEKQGETEEERNIRADTESRLGSLEAKLKTIEQAEKLRRETAMRSLSDDDDDGEEEDDDDDDHEMEGDSDDDDEGARIADVPGLDDRTEEETVDELMMENYKKMFKGLVFFVSRECPRGPLEFLIRCFGGKVGWDSPESKISRLDESITHEIVDRPNLSDRRDDREYIQPQWVFDCVNARVRLPVEPYRPGSRLPPHLSPFVEYEHDSYVPKYALEIRKLVEMERSALLNKGTAGSIIAVEDEEHDVADDEGEDQEEDMYQRELAAERSGKKFTELQKEIEQEKLDRERDAILDPSSVLRKPKTTKEKREEEEVRLRELMMSRRTQKRYQAELQKREQKASEIASLKRRRLLIEMEEEQKERERKQKAEKLARENALFNMENEDEALKLMAEQDKEGSEDVDHDDDDAAIGNDDGDEFDDLDDLSSASDDEDDGFDFDDIDVEDDEVGGSSDDDDDEEEEDVKPARQPPAPRQQKQHRERQRQNKDVAGKKRKHREVSTEKKHAVASKQVAKKRKARK